MEVARDEVIHAGENSGCEDRLVLESQVYAGRNNLHWAVADHACSQKKLFEAGVMGVGRDIAADFIDGESRKRGCDVAHPPEVQKAVVLDSRG